MGHYEDAINILHCCGGHNEHFNECIVLEFLEVNDYLYENEED